MKLYEQMYVVDFDEIQSIEDIKDILKSLDIMYTMDDPNVMEIEHLLTIAQVEVEEVGTA